VTAAETAAAARRLLERRMSVTMQAGGEDEALTASGARGQGGEEAGLVGAWPRAVAVLGRQALEHALDDFWSAEAPLVRAVPRHPQLVCLGAYLPAGDVVSGVRAAWHGLSRACHHHVYELPPTAEELGRWLDAVEAFIRYDPCRRD
jgi:hypothetical protein